jgi:hypothetical protein
MLANARAFEGDTVSDTIAAILTKDPDWTRVRADAPRFLVDVARRCLRKDPRLRPQAIGDVRIALEEAGADGDADAEGSTVAHASGLYPRSWRSPRR